MTVELLQLLSIVAYIVAGVLFLASAALFFLLDVPKLYGDISGRTAKKAIEAIRLQNESSGNKAYKPSPINAERGKLTDKITQSGRLEPQGKYHSIGVGTEKFSTSSLHPSNNETTVLNDGMNETTVLSPGPDNAFGETTVLSYNTDETESNIDKFEVDIELAFVGSSEIIV